MNTMQKQAARKFVECWTFRRGSEKGEDQQFWNSLLGEVLGMEDVASRVQYQVPVPKKGTTKFLDAWIPETRVLIEHKSRGIKLDAPQSGHGGKTPFEQALEYNIARPFSEKARWLSRDPLEEQGGLNLYGFCGNCCCRYADAMGKSVYIKDDHEPPRRNILTANTWNTLTPASSTFGIRFRANLTILGGEIKSMPDAARHFRHFLDNSGTPLEIRFGKMNQEDPSARAHLERELEDGILYAEKLASSDGRFIMVTPSETSRSAASGNWLYAVGEYTTWARASVVKCGNFFQ